MDTFLLIVNFVLVLVLIGVEGFLLSYHGRRVIVSSLTWWSFVVRSGLWAVLLGDSILERLGNNLITDNAQALVQILIVLFLLSALVSRYRLERRRRDFVTREADLEAMRVGW